VKRIEIHGVRGDDGTPYVLNHFDSDNAGCSDSSGDGWLKRRNALRRKAERDADMWRRVFPDDTIIVVDVDTAKVRQRPQMSLAEVAAPDVTSSFWTIEQERVR
jgi:hypothetical protein